MHGLIFNELHKYADLKFGSGTAKAILKEAGLETKFYLPIKDYPDAEILAQLGAASKLSGKSVDFLLDDFGEYAAHQFITGYKALIEQNWKALDLIENTEQTIHTIVRVRNVGSSPPELKYDRVNENELKVFYSSPRKLCVLAKGVIRGISNHYKEPLLISEPKCMHKGDNVCEILLKKTS